MGRIGRLYVLREPVSMHGRIGRLYPAYLHPWVVNLGGESESEVKDEGGEGGVDRGISE